jgi:hypothetical protein
MTQGTGLIDPALFELEKLVRNVECRHDRNPFGANDAAAIPDLPGLVIEVTGCQQEFMLFVSTTGNRVFLAENLNLDGRIGFTHDVFS